MTTPPSYDDLVGMIRFCRLMAASEPGWYRELRRHSCAGCGGPVLTDGTATPVRHHWPDCDTPTTRRAS